MLLNILKRKRNTKKYTKKTTENNKLFQQKNNYLNKRICVLKQLKFYDFLLPELNLSSLFFLQPNVFAHATLYSRYYTIICQRGWIEKLKAQSAGK